MFRHTSYSPTVRTAAVADPLTYQLEHFYSPTDRQGCAAVQASSAELQASGGKVSTAQHRIETLPSSRNSTETLNTTRNALLA